MLNVKCVDTLYLLTFVCYIQDVLEFLVENGGRTTNNEIVQQFSSAFRCPINGTNNKVTFIICPLELFLEY